MTLHIGGKQRREKLFGEGRSIPLDRNAKVRIMVLARALMRRTDKGKHYGLVTAKFVAVLEALLWGFHNAATGRCYPSYDTIADRAGCARSTVYEAIRALETAGILTWVNRLVRIRETGVDLFGQAANRWRVIRTSNAYVFRDPQVSHAATFASKSELQTGTGTQDLFFPRVAEAGLQNALERLRKGVGKAAVRGGAGVAGTTV